MKKNLKTKCVSHFIATLLFAFIIDAMAFGHIDTQQMRNHTTNVLAHSIAECYDDPECIFSPQFEDHDNALPLLSPESIRAARFVVACLDIAGCKNSSMQNFTSICEKDSVCGEMNEEFFDLSTTSADECLLNHDCKSAMKRCFEDPTCESLLKAVISNPTAKNYEKAIKNRNAKEFLDISEIIAHDVYYDQ